jgi:hypothetical protein
MPKPRDYSEVGRKNRLMEREPDGVKDVVHMKLLSNNMISCFADDVLEK